MNYCRLLLLDDVEEDREIVKLLSKRFLKLKVEVVEASKEAELLEIYSKDKNYDCIVLNTSMATEKILNFLEVIQKKSGHKKIAIVGLMDEACVSRTEKLSELGVWKFLLKEQISAANLEFVMISAMNLQQLQDELENKNAALEISNKKLKDLVTIVAHDLRSPLSSLISYFEILDVLEEKEKERVIEHIKKASQRMMNLIDDVLDLNKIDKELFEIECESLNPVEIMQCIRFEAQFAAKEKEINLKLVMPEEELICFCDRERIHQVILNLLLNAIKFSYPKSEVIFGIKKENNKLVFFVKDEGVGIEKNKIFSILKEPEAYITMGTTGECGNGIGLVLAQKILKLHQSTLEVISEKGEGSHFLFRLPLEI